MAEEDNLTPPDCPKCGAIMVLQTAQRGKYRGQQFWGCSDFPSCKKIVNIEGESEAIKNDPAVKNILDSLGGKIVESSITPKESQ